MTARRPDHAEFRPDPKSAAGILYNTREEILNEWIQRVRKCIRAAEKEREPILVDTVPSFIINISQSLMPEFPRDIATDTNTVAEEHGGERARVTNYSPDDVIREFQILRDLLITKLEDNIPLTPQERSIIIRSCDKGMTDSIMAFFLVHSSVREKFTITLTHDLRTPLNVIKACAQIIIKKPASLEQHLMLSARIVDNVDRMDRMIEDVLDVSRVRSGEELSFQFEPCELQSLVQDVIDNLSTVHGARFELDSTEIHGFWSGEAIKRAVENLCTNAVKYGDILSTVKIQLSETHKRVLISVHNTGSYIPVEDQETLFQTYMRTNIARNSNKKGWGIGLALVRGVAEAHGGSVGVDSSPERGTTFTIDMPQDPRTL